MSFVFCQEFFSQPISGKYNVNVINELKSTTKAHNKKDYTFVNDYKHLQTKLNK
ncbi:MAG: hypothetical protein ACX93I_00420 [Winogradskyella sp.]|jgi:hypothetical protein